jgi:predicted nucleotidyltransferase
MNPQELTSKLRDACGENLASVILYGSAADGEFHRGLSDYNIIIVLKNMAPLELARPCAILKKWVKCGNPPPLFFSPEVISSSADVFPIEFFDIIERRKMLFGNDPFKDVRIDPKNLRHQCEHELRSRLLTLRSRFSLISDRPKEVIRLILESSSSFFAAFGGILRLAGARPKALKKELAEQLSKLTDIDTTIFMEVVEVRDGSRIWRKDEALEKFEQFLTSIQAVVKYVDKF